ncbi:hypothetical protein JCM11491_005429 [Sporobolomyces phaffii]
MVHIDNAVLPQGSLVLGANGFVASHVIKHLLSLGYKVRGTVRTPSSIEPFKQRWASEIPGSHFEAIQVENLRSKDALEEAIKGVDGVIHLAQDMSLSTDYEAVVGGAVGSALNLLEVAKSNPRVKRFVLTSSAIAVGFNRDPANPDRLLDDKVWNTPIIEYAKSLSADAPDKGGVVYAASKTKVELEAWKYVNDNKPGFDFSVVLPFCTLGETYAGPVKSMPAYLHHFFLSQSQAVAASLPTMEVVSVDDVALLHVAALLVASVSQRRILASAHPVNRNDLLASFRRLYPAKSFYPDLVDQPAAVRVLDAEPARDILKAIGKPGDGWDTLDDMVKQTVDAVA